MLYIKRVKGHKGASDSVIRIKTEGWHQITYEEIAQILIPLMQNEEGLYPQSKGFLGWHKPLEYLIQVYEQAAEGRMIPTRKESV